MRRFLLHTRQWCGISVYLPQLQWIVMTGGCSSKLMGICSDWSGNGRILFKRASLAGTSSRFGAASLLTSNR